MGASGLDPGTGWLRFDAYCLTEEERFKIQKEQEAKAKENKKENKEYRVQLDFSEDAFRELNELQKQLSASSRAEVIRNALGVLRWVARHLLEGNKIVVETKEGKRVEVDFPFLLLK